MHIFNNKEHQERNNKKIYQGSDDFTIQNTSIRKILHLLHFQFRQNRIEDKRGYQIIDHTFDKFSYFSSNKQSYSDTNDIVLRKKRHKFFDHHKRKKDKT